jgi:hypothetical protein
VNPKAERLAWWAINSQPKGPDGLPETVRLPVANAFGAHVLQVGQPELLFLPSLVE